MKKRYFLNLDDMIIETGLDKNTLLKLIDMDIFYLPQKKPVLLFFSKDIEKGIFIKNLISLGYKLNEIKKIVKEIGLPATGQEKNKKDQLYPIGEFCKRFQLSARRIKYWENIGLFFPAVRSKGGIRLYSESLIIHVRFIEHLQELNFSLEEIKDIINKNQYEKIENRINKLNETIRVLKPIIKNMKKLK